MGEPVFMHDGQDPHMKQSFKAAQNNFKYFWRELSWERRRIVPALGMAAIKLPFTDGQRSDGNPEYEYMWCDEVEFDGEYLSGQIVNDPNWLVSVKKGDSINVPLSKLADWLMVSNGVAYGGYTINLMRSAMQPKERKGHDEAWGLDFGDPNVIRTEIKPENHRKGIFSKLFGSKRDKASRVAPQDEFCDHPMCIKMLETYESQLKKDPSLTLSTDDRGWTLLHHEALAGNLGIVRLLVRYGAKVDTATPSGKGAATLAGSIGWDEIATYLARPKSDYLE